MKFSLELSAAHANQTLSNLFILEKDEKQKVKFLHELCQKTYEVFEKRREKQNGDKINQIDYKDLFLSRLKKGDMIEDSGDYPKVLECIFAQADNNPDKKTIFQLLTTTIENNFPKTPNASFTPKGIYSLYSQQMRYLD